MAKSKGKSFDPRDYFSGFKKLEKKGKRKSCCGPKGKSRSASICDASHWVMTGMLLCQEKGHAPWFMYGSMLGALESIKEEGKSGKKTTRRHKKAVKAIRKFIKQASGEDAVEAPTAKKKKKKKTDQKQGSKFANAAAVPKAKSNKKKKKNKASGARKESGAIEHHVTEPDPIEAMAGTNGSMRSETRFTPANPSQNAQPETARSRPVGLLNMVSEPEEGARDDLKWISGVGPKLEETLHGLGVYTFAQIADWTTAEIEWVEEYLQFPGRIERDNWIEQAKVLAKGGWDEYVKVFGKEPR